MRKQDTLTFKQNKKTQQIYFHLYMLQMLFQFWSMF